MKRGLLLLWILASGLGTAHADDDAEAEQLFRDGKALMKQGRYGDACTAFETSQKLAPAVSTLLNLADCREKNGQLASAWSLFLEAQRDTRDDAKLAAFNKTATERAAALEPRLSYMTVSVPDESRIDGLALTRNDAAFEEGLWNRAIPVDGGEYAIAGHAPGHEEWSTTVHVPQENGRVSVDVPKFKEVEKLMTTPEPLVERKPVVVERRVAAPRASITPRRKVALGVAALGVVGAGAGIVLGLQAKGFERDASDLCPATACGAQADAANALVARAERRALYANVSFGVAAAAVAGAAILWFTGAPPRESSVAVVPAADGFAIVGRF